MLLKRKKWQPEKEKGPGKKAREGLFTRAPSDRTGGNGLTLTECRFGFGIGKKFFTIRGGEILKQVAQRSCGLYMFKIRLDGALPNMA